MAFLSNDTIQKLAVLQALLLWRKGAYGPVRLQKTLFFADENSSDQDWRLFTFKRCHLGQYSDEISNALNSLQSAERIQIHFDGPSQRIEAMIPQRMKKTVGEFFRDYFGEWSLALRRAFAKWAYLNNDQILVMAHDDPSYTHSKHGNVIARSRLADHIDFIGLDKKTAEALADLVDPMLARAVRTRLHKAAKRPRSTEDWRTLYFPDETVAC